MPNNCTCPTPNKEAGLHHNDGCEMYLPMGAVELKEGIEVYCHTNFLYNDEVPTDIRIGWHKVLIDEDNRACIGGDGWFIGVGYNIDKYIDLANPRYPHSELARITNLLKLQFTHVCMLRNSDIPPAAIEDHWIDFCKANNIVNVKK